MGRARDKLGEQIGTENVDKMGEIALVALGYAEDETCLCCPCMPRSQVWSLSSFKVSCQLLMNDLNQDLPVYLLLTPSTFLSNKGLFELT